MKVRVIGAGLAGCEASYYLANKGVEVELIDEKPTHFTPAHKSEHLSELVCSNSLKSDAIDNACGLLKHEMRCIGSLFMESADNNKLKAGQDLVVDREGFSKYISNKIFNHPNIKFISKVASELPNDDIKTIITTGPLTEKDLSNDIQSVIGEQMLSFYDSAAPLVFASSLDLTKLYKKSRYDKGDGEYYNCPLTKEQYYNFVDKIVESPTIILHDFEHFEGCLPIEVMAKRGPDTLRFGPMKAKGLEIEGAETQPYAVVQLRQDDEAKKLFNIVGFQTNLTFKAQKELLSMLPGFENVKFARFGVMHRNTYILAPVALDRNLSLKKRPNIKIAGQLSGVEGYVESSACGLLAAIYTYQELTNSQYDPIPLNTMLGSLINYLIMSSPKHFSPMNATYGILRAGTKDKEQIYQNSLKTISEWKKKNNC